MPQVLTTSNTVSCGHDPGRVSTTGTSKLRVSGSAVLLKSGIELKSITACSTPPASDNSGPTAKACTTVSSVTAGEASKLTIDGKGVMLASQLKGETDGMVAKETPQKLLKATSSQSKLTAI